MLGNLVYEKVRSQSEGGSTIRHELVDNIGMLTMPSKKMGLALHFNLHVYTCKIVNKVLLLL